MKTLKINLVITIAAFGLSIGMLTFSNCSSDEADPCSALECFNGGEKIPGKDKCECDCPEGYSGVNCEIKPSGCIGVECPIGKSPNPGNGCACE